MKVTLVGMGSGFPGTLTQEAKEALLGADCLLGAPRLLEDLGEEYPSRRFAAIHPRQLVELLEREQPERPCVLYSGDTGFHSGAGGLLSLLRDQGWKAEVLPGISSIQLLSARLGEPWQGWHLASAHGADCDPAALLREHQTVFFLTGGRLGPAELCGLLIQAGFEQAAAVVGENLGRPGENLVRGTVGELAEKTFASLSVLLVRRPVDVPSLRQAVTPGIPDGEFCRSEGKTVPMTKREVRAAAMGLLEIGADDLLWDVGAGTGSVSVEMALLARRGKVFAVEEKPEACALIRENGRKFGVSGNLEVMEGRAPEALEQLPAPDAVFVGGSGGELPEILRLIRRLSPRARICVSAIALETVHLALETLTELGDEVHVTQLAVSRAKGVGRLHLMMAQNPIFLITGGCHE